MARKYKITDTTSSFQKMSVLDGAKAYAVLREKVKKQGIFNRSYSYYAGIICIVFLGFFISMYAIFVTKLSLLLFLWGIVFAFFSVQIGGLLHDAGHRSIFNSTKMNDFFGNIFGAFLAQDFTFWKIKHNLHHAHPNQDDADPDVKMPLLSFTKDDFDRKKGLAKILKPYQAFLYYPLGSLVVFSPRLGSLKYFMNNFKKEKIGELILFLCGFFLWFILPFLVFDPQKAFVLFIIVNATAGIYLLNVFAPNHKGMPAIGKGVKISFMEQQIMTSRNIYGHWFTDFVYMGLNYQIEHHLFPHTPRNKLKQITPFVLAFCRTKKLEYTNVSVIETNKIILSELHQIAKSRNN